jgi:hypothetical protein
LIAERALSRRQLCAVRASGWWVVVGARTAHDLHRTRSRPIGFKVQGAARIAGRLRTERSTDASGAIAGGGDVRRPQSVSTGRRRRGRGHEGLPI